MTTRTLAAWGIVATAPALAWMGYFSGGSPWQQLLYKPTAFIILLMLNVIAVLIMERDLWLGLFAGWALLNVWQYPDPRTVETSMLVTMGCLAIAVLSVLTESQRRIARWVLVGGGLVHITVQLMQATGQDPIWSNHFAGYNMSVLGNRGYLGNLLAFLAPLAPAALIPLFLIGLVLAKSSLSALAAIVGLGVRYPKYRLAWVVIGAGALVGFATYRPDWISSYVSRFTIWGLALEHTSWWQMVIGHGTGTWQIWVPHYQETQHVYETGPFVQAHNEWLQVFFEGGLIGFGILSMWLWSHRAVFSTPWAGSVVALGVVSMAWFPFHLGNLALPALVVLGCAFMVCEQPEPVVEAATRTKRSPARLVTA